MPPPAVVASGGFQHIKNKHHVRVFVAFHKKVYAYGSANDTTKTSQLVLRQHGEASTDPLNP